MADGCYACTTNARSGTLPPREEIVAADGWRLVHAFDAALPGWLVLVPDRHVTALDELGTEEAAAMGRLLHAGSAALRAVLGCTKTYVALFAEAEGFAHLHVHVVPRMPDLPADRLGPRVFGYLDAAPDDRVPDAEQDALALRLRAAPAAA